MYDLFYDLLLFNYVSLLIDKKKKCIKSMFIFLACANIPGSCFYCFLFEFVGLLFPLEITFILSKGSPCFLFEVRCNSCFRHFRIQRQQYVTEIFLDSDCCRRSGYGSWTSRQLRVNTMASFERSRCWNPLTGKLQPASDDAGTSNHFCYHRRLVLLEPPPNLQVCYYWLFGLLEQAWIFAASAFLTFAGGQLSFFLFCNFCYHRFLFAGSDAIFCYIRDG